MKALYPGTFDPITHGHLDIINRASTLYDEVIVAVYENRDKSPFLTTKKRIELVTNTTKHLHNIRVIQFSHKLLVDIAQKHGAKVLIRGLRALSDFEYEIALAQTNKHLAPNIETVFLMASNEYSFISSSLVRELSSLGADITHMVPKVVAETLSQE